MLAPESPSSCGRSLRFSLEIRTWVSLEEESLTRHCFCALAAAAARSAGLFADRPALLRRSTHPLTAAEAGNRDTPLMVRQFDTVGGP